MAKQLGQDLEDHEQQTGLFVQTLLSIRFSIFVTNPMLLWYLAVGSVKTTESVVAGLKLHQAYDFLEAMKKMVEEDQGHKAKAILEAYPQLIPACVEIQRRLGMVNIQVAADQKPTSLSVIESINTAPTITQSAYQQHLLQQVNCGCVLYYIKIALTGC